MRLGIVIRSPAATRKIARWGIPVLWVLGAGLLVASVFAFSFYLAMRIESRSTEVQVPDLGGMDLEVAAKLVEPLDLVLQVDDQRHDPAVPSGRVLQQMPPPGSSVRRGRKVKLIVSLGGKVIELPDLIGQAARAVEIELRQEGLVPGSEARVHQRNAAPGTVVAQVPPVHTPAVPKTRVHLLVSDGPDPATWVMPDLEGLSRAAAERWISSVGFRRGAVRRVRMSDWPSDTVIGQLPLAGYPVRANDIVELSVSSREP